VLILKAIINLILFHDVGWNVSWETIGKNIIEMKRKNSRNEVYTLLLKLKNKAYFAL